MKLKEYIEKYRKDPEEFRKKCKISRASYYSYLNGRCPHFSTAIRIEKATDGHVTVEELRGNEDEKREEKS